MTVHIVQALDDCYPDNTYRPKGSVFEYDDTLGAIGGPIALHVPAPASVLTTTTLAVPKPPWTTEGFKEAEQKRKLALERMMA